MSPVETVDGVHSVMVHKARGVGVIDDLKQWWTCGT